MKKLKVVIILLVLLILIGGLVSLIVSVNKTKVNQTQENQQVKQEKVEEKKVESKIVTNSAMYFTVESCVDRYVDCIQNMDKKSVYKLLDLAYIKDNNITQDNILEYTGTILKGCDFDVQKILLIKGDGEDLQQYYVYGLIRQNDGQKINRQKAYLTVNVDLQNMTFSIVPNVAYKEVFDE